MKQLLALLALLLATVTAQAAPELSLTLAGPQDSLAVVQHNGKPHIQYQVEQGESLWKLAKRYSVTVAELLAANPSAETGLKVGQQIFIPFNQEKLQAAAGAATPVKAAEPQPKVEPKPEPKAEPKQLAKAPEPAEPKAAEPKPIEPKPVAKPVEQPKAAEPKPAEPKPEPRAAVEPKPAAPVQAAPKPIAPVQAAAAAPVQPEKAAVNAEPEAQGLSQRVVDNRQKIDTTPDLSNRRLLIIPFDPYLYFSDADDEIAERSKIPRQQIRQFFRRRLDALMAPAGYETIRLLGASARDSVRDLDRIYASLSYQYEPVKVNPLKPASAMNAFDIRPASWGANSKTNLAKLMPSANANRKPVAQERHEGKYYAVKVKDPGFFQYFNSRYNVQYYVFINQFEVKTNYENCLDRARQDYERNFIAHFSIFDYKGRQVAGNRVKIYYNSNSNNIMQIVSENMQKMADAILSELP